jgi:predicted PurR-regulated permease PerM
VKFSQWLSLIILGVCLYIVWQIRDVLLLALAAVVFAVVMNRAVRFLQRRIESRGVAVLALMASVALFLSVIGLIFVPPFVNQLQELVDLAPQVIDRIRDWISNLENIVPAFSLQNVQSIENLFQQLQSLDVEMLFGRFYTLFSNTLTVTLNVLLVTVLTFMMLLDPQPYRRLFIATFPSSNRRQVNRVLDYCEEAIAGWFIGILFNMTVIAIMSTLGLWILGIPLAFANGILAGLLAFIPNLGPVMSVIPPAAIALLETPWKAIAVVVLYIVIQQVESNILTPLVMQKQVSLLPAVTLLAQVIFAVFFGFLGLLLALPLTLIIQQWLNEFWVKGFADQH